MSGLDKLLNQIESTAQGIASAKLTQANQQAEALILEAENNAREESQKKLQETAVEVDEIVKRAKSAAALQKRKAVLAAKQQMIEDIIHRTQDMLKSMSSEDYFDLIRKMVSSYALPEDGEIIFSKQDQDRFPVNFENQLAELIQLKGGSLKISAENRPIDGGFVLVYGEIEENCSFEAIFTSKSDILQDKINKLLFT
ncbi:MAG: V-type ATP synthase subunit E [Clostridia bacterium]|nr:V-type ATP synthase subunit E [Clostridia bacterium]MDD4681373.1 V-type ATP synthase subunit E [Clostridia bacterium]